MTRKTKPDPVTDARSAVHLSSWASNWNPALMPVADFIDAVDGGKVPKPQDMQHIATALREMFCHRDTDATMQIVARKLGLKRKQGKRELAGNEDEQMQAATFAMLERERELIRSGQGARAARAQAVREIAAHEGVATRTAQAWRKEYGEYAAAVLRAVEITSGMGWDAWQRARKASRNKNPG